MRFNLRELSGSLGDLGLFIPIVLAVCISTDMHIGVVLIAAGAMNIATGFLFNQPIPVQPMKAIAAVAIADGLNQSQLMASGLLMGVILLLLVHTGWLRCVVDKVPKVLIRGIQVGVGLKLILLAFEWVSEMAFIGSGVGFSWFDTSLSAIVILLVLLLSLKSKFPVLLLIVSLGLLYAGLKHALNYDDSSYQSFQYYFQNLSFPQTHDFVYSFWYAVLPQLPLTLLNSVIAICALSADYFPKKAISTDKMASSVAWMNIVCSPFGALPMCHGASGLAAQYQFGARTGGSIVMLGLIKIVLALLFTGFLIQAMSVYPKSVLAPLLIVAGLSLCKSAWSERQQLNLWVFAATVAGIVFVNTLVGFVVGILSLSLFWLFKQKDKLNLK